MYMHLKICQLCAVDFTVEHFLTPLIDGMHAQGWQVTSVCSNGKYVPGLRERGYKVETVSISRGLNPLRHTVSLIELVRLFRREKFDVVHVHTPIAALIGRIAARLCSVPMVVYTAHGFYFHENMKRLPKTLFLMLEKFGGKLTDLLFTQSTEDARTAIDERLAPIDRILAIGNGVDVKRFDGSRTDSRHRVRRELGIPLEAVVIGMIGRMVAEKGYREFFEAAKIVDEQGSQAYFVVIGERLPSDHAAGVEVPLAEAQRSLGPRLILAGPRKDIPELLSAMDIFTLPSYREGMPRTIIEAMMMSLPVVATDIRGSREEVLTETTGLLVPVGDTHALTNAFSRLIHDPELRRSMGENGRRRALELYDESKVIAMQIAAIRQHLPETLRARV